MYTMDKALREYLQYCREQRRLDLKTVKAYENDLKQFWDYSGQDDLMVPKETMKAYMVSLHEQYKQKTVKRKIASIKAFYTYLENEEIIDVSPLRRVKTEFRQEIILPKTIPANVIEELLYFMYHQKESSEMTV